MRFPSRIAFSLALVLPLTVACGDDSMGDGGLDDGSVVGDGGERNGCNVLTAPLASPGDPIDGDTYETFASGFFTDYCTRCHGTTVVEPEREGAPLDRNWDDEASVRMYLPLIRSWVGELNAMPLGDPMPTCDERARLVRWIDAAAP
jgi:hypothetical protein